MTTAIPHPLGDLEPPLEVQLQQTAELGEAGATRDSDGTWWKPIDLTTALSVAVHVEPLDTDDRAPKIARNGVIFQPEAGKVRLIWQDGDPVFVLGLYRVWTVILWPGDRPQTSPGRPEDYVTLRVFSPRQR